MQAGRTIFSTNKSSDIWQSEKTIFFKKICPWRRTSRRQYDINSHQTDKCQTICSSSSVKTAINPFARSCPRRWRSRQPFDLRRLSFEPAKTPETKLIYFSLKPESFQNFDKFLSRIFFYTSGKLFNSFVSSYYLSTDVLLRKFNSWV